MLKFEIPKRLIGSTIIMSLIIVLIVVIIFSIINEKGKIKSALKLSQQNRAQLLKTESVTESLLLVEARFKEYCITFETPVFEEYKTSVKNLVENIQLLYEIVSKDSTDSTSIDNILEKRTKEADIYVRLKLATDSLIFSVGSLDENQIEIEKYIGHLSYIRIDTLSVTATNDIYKKGLFGKIKSAIVGEKIQQNVSTKIRVQSPTEGNNLNSDLLRMGQTTKISANSSKTSQLFQTSQKLKESELKLIKINDSLIFKIRKLIDEIKSNIRIHEEAQNNSFLNSVQHSTDFLQNILIVLMLLACFFAGYILFLAYKNDKFQRYIIFLNQKITKDSIQKDKFFSIIGHDLMNPFNALLGFSEMLSDSVEKGNKEDSIEYSSIVNESARRIFNLLQNLLVWSKMQNGKIKYSPKMVKVDELVSDSMMILTPIARNKDINLQWEVIDDITAILDSNMIGSVLQNLGTNAIKFTERGGSVTVTAYVETGTINFTVSDTGVGMSEERLNKLFKLDKTSSSRGTDDEVGTGLGLIICKEFVESHQGKIWVESTLGKGSKFSISIPLS